MNKITLAKRNSAIFLSALLFLGTIATILPSVKAQPYYEDRYNPDYKDSDYYKSKDNSSISANKIICNNINANLNGVNISSGLPTDDAIAGTQAGANEDLATTVDNNGERNGYNKNGNDFRFVCINNNDNENNVVVVNGTAPEPPEPDLACEECFAASSNLQTTIIEALVNFDSIMTITVAEPPITGFLIIGPGTDTIEQFCDMIEASSKFYGVPITDVLLESFISGLLGGEIDPTLESEFDALIECLLEKGIIVEGDLPPPDSLSVTGQ